MDRIEQARQHGLPGTVISGQSGTGKTRLARAAAELAECDGAIVARALATRSGASVPLGAFASVIPHDVRSDHHFELMRACARALRERAGAQPMVIAIDDAHWLDHTSATLALHLAMTGVAFILATVNPEEDCPDAIMALCKDAGAPRLELGLLAPGEVVELTEAIVGGRVEPSVRSWITGVAGGNPLYVRELILGALESGLMHKRRGLWRMASQPPVSKSLVEIIEGRLAGLTASEQRAVRLLALGQPLRFSEMLSLVSADSLTALEERGVVITEDAASGASARLSDPLYSEVVRLRLPSLAARELWLELAQTLQDRVDPEPEDTVRLARWLTEAGEPIATNVLLCAARDATHAGDAEFGAALAAQALEAGAGVEAALLLARALAAQSSFEDAASVLAGCEAAIKTRDQAFRYLSQQAEVLHWALGRSDEIRAVLDRATVWWSDKDWVEQLAPLRLLATQVDDMRSVTSRRGDGNARSTDGVPSEYGGQLQPARIKALLHSGRVRDAYKLALQIRPEPPLGTLTELISLVTGARVTLEHGDGWTELDRWMSEALDRCAQLGDHRTAGVAAYVLAHLRTLAGRLKDATELLADAEAQLERQDPLGLLCVVDAQLAVVCAMSGVPDAAEAALAQSLRRCGGQEPPLHQLPYVIRAHAWTSHARGKLRTAQELLLDGAERLAASPAHSASLRYDAMRLGADPKKLVASFTELRGRCDSRLVAAYAEHAVGRVTQDGFALLKTAHEMESIGALRYASEVAANAAEVFVQEGRMDSARRAAGRSRSLFIEGQGASPPVVAGLSGPAAGLTPRESELVGLAARGMSNAEIADCLVLSIRTVESHLYRAMRKLGISDRRDLQVQTPGHVGSSQ